MPKTTFLNLPDDKKQRIFQSAVAEFGDFPFETASISRIVRNSGISKGSFYQYFEDKKDLFRYVVSVVSDKKHYLMEKILEQKKNLPFFSMLRELFFEGCLFGKNNPELAAIADNLMKDPYLKEEFLNENLQRVHEFAVKLLKIGLDKGEVDDGIDLYFTAGMLISLNIGIAHCLSREAKYSDLELRSTVEKMMNFVENGIKIKKYKKNKERK
ncbi:MAG: TetR/AcrR family transcriptional regulator [Candidatus Wallbacteria bacterium]|nr:TetR/AcrR family transcriptional regulator [Candidatus Wallbacteria bacterium]